MEFPFDTRIEYGGGYKMYNQKSDIILPFSQTNHVEQQLGFKKCIPIEKQNLNLSYKGQQCEKEEQNIRDCLYYNDFNITNYQKLKLKQVFNYFALKDYPNRIQILQQPNMLQREQQSIQENLQKEQKENQPQTVQNKLQQSLQKKEIVKTHKQWKKIKTQIIPFSFDQRNVVKRYIQITKKQDYPQTKFKAKQAPKYDNQMFNKMTQNQKKKSQKFKFLYSKQVFPNKQQEEKFNKFYTFERNFKANKVPKQVLENRFDKMKKDEMNRKQLFIQSRNKNKKSIQNRHQQEKKKFEEYYHFEFRPEINHHVPNFKQIHKSLKFQQQNNRSMKKQQYKKPQIIQTSSNLLQNKQKIYPKTTKKYQSYIQKKKKEKQKNEQKISQQIQKKNKKMKISTKHKLHVIIIKSQFKELNQQLDIYKNSTMTIKQQKDGNKKKIKLSIDFIINNLYFQKEVNKYNIDYFQKYQTKQQLMNKLLSKQYKQQWKNRKLTCQRIKRTQIYNQDSNIQKQIQWTDQYEPII